MMKYLAFISIISFLLVGCDGSGGNDSNDTTPKEAVVGSCLHRDLLQRDPRTQPDTPPYKAYAHMCYQGQIGATRITDSWCERAADKYDKKKEFFKFTPNGTCSLEKAAAVCEGTHDQGRLSMTIYDTEGFDLEKGVDALSKTCEHLKLEFRIVP